MRMSSARGTRHHQRSVRSDMGVGRGRKRREHTGRVMRCALEFKYFMSTRDVKTKIWGTLVNSFAEFELL
jgi:hypothetical protein